MPICFRCKQPRKVDGFNWRNKRLGTRQRRCKSCQSAETMNHYQRNKQSYIDRARAAKELKKQKIVKYLSLHPCVKCGCSEIVLLDFHHLDPKKKSSDICALIRRSAPWPIIESEIQKCEVWCVVCHRRHTAEQFGYYKSIVITANTSGSNPEDPGSNPGGLAIQN